MIKLHQQELVVSGKIDYDNAQAILYRWSELILATAGFSSGGESG